MLRINRRRTRTRGVSPRGGFALSRVHRTRTRFLEELVDTDEKKKKDTEEEEEEGEEEEERKKKSEYFVKRRARNAAASSYFTRRGLVRGTSHTGSYLGDLIPGNVLSSYISADLAASPSLSLSSSPLSTRFFSPFNIHRALLPERTGPGEESERSVVRYLARGKEGAG